MVLDKVRVEESMIIVFGLYNRDRFCSHVKYYYYVFAFNLIFTYLQDIKLLDMPIAAYLVFFSNRRYVVA